MREDMLKKWRQFHDQNPHVYRLFKRFTREAIASGRERFGARMIWERMRWFTLIEAQDHASDFKLNDHYPAYYARLFMEDHSRYDGFFETRDRW